MKKQRRERSLGPGTYLCESLESRTLLSAVTLIKDIDPGNIGGPVLPLVRVGNLVYFQADNGKDGHELYRSDGTAAGTIMLTNNFPGNDLAYGLQQQAVALNGKCYFASVSPAGVGISVSDGTVAGTSLVKLLYPAINTTVNSLIAVGQKMYFSVTSSTANGELWVSDGTAAGTQPLGQSVPAVDGLSAGALLAMSPTQFCVPLFAQNAWRIFVSDGTAAGTHSVFVDSVSYKPLFACNGEAFFSGSSSPSPLILISSTGQATQQISAAMTVTSYVADATRGYFIGNNALYKTDGTVANTTLVTALTSPKPGIGMLSNGSAIFLQDTAVNSGVTAVMRSDGTAAGTIQLTTYTPAVFGTNDLTNFARVGSLGVFRISTSTHAAELWSTDGTVVGTKQLAINPQYTSSAENFLNDRGSPAYFSAADSAHGEELWKTDGTLAGTTIAGDVNLLPQGSDPSPLVLINNKYWFIAYDGVSAQPWTTDLTSAGTVPVNTDPNTFSAFGGDFIPLGSKVYFRGYQSTASTAKRILFSSTGSGITAVTNSGGFPQSVGVPVVFNGAVYVGGNDAAGAKLWKSDGTAAGTVVVTGSPALEANATLGTFGNYLFFVGANGTVSSLSNTGTITPLKAFGTVFNTIFATATVFNGKYYFLASSTAGTQLWQSDGTAAGTVLVKTVTSGRGSPSLVSAGSVLYIVFDANVYKSDGTAAGTVNVPVQIGSTPSSVVGVNGKLFAGVNSGTPHVWTSNGTTAGTFDLTSLSQAFNPRTLGVAGNYAYFSMHESLQGDVLWRSDGTLAGTVPVIDTNPGFGDSAAGPPQLINNALYLPANDGVHGRELMKISLSNLIIGTASADAVTLTQNADHAHIDWHTGADTGQITIADANGLTINGNGGADTITLASTGENPLPAVLHLNGTFTLNGLVGANPLANTALDINASTLFITYANAASDPLAILRSALKNGYNAGQWTGSPTASTGVIASTVAAADTAHKTGIGYADSADGLVSLPANTIELKYTLYGDTGLISSVGFTDFMRMTQHFTQTAGVNWGRGDFNYDGVVNAADFNLLQANYGDTFAVPAQDPIVTAPTAPVRPTRVATLPPPAASSLVDSTASASLVDTDGVTKKGKQKSVGKAGKKHH